MSRNKKFGFYAFDAGPSKMLSGIAETATAKGHETVTLPSIQQGVAMSRIESLRECSAVLVGLSTHQIAEETNLIEELSRSEVPVVVVEDSHGMSLRPGAKHIAPLVAADIVALPSGIDRAREFGYKNAVHIGPPYHWGKEYEQLMKAAGSKSLLRKKRPDTAVAHPLEPDDIFVTIEGGKGRPLQINRVIKAIRDAIIDIAGDKVVLHFGKHPGERAEREDEEELYELAFEERERILMEKNTWLVANANLTSPERVGSADLSIFTGGGPTQSVTGAYARKTTAYWSADAAKIMKDQVAGTDSWFVADLGGTYPLSSSKPDDVRRDIAYVLSPEGKESLRASQEKNFPLPKEWDCRDKIVTFVESLARE